MTEFTTTPTDAETRVRIGNTEILSNYGNTDNKCMVIKYPKQISRNRSKIYYWPVYDTELYIGYMESISMYNQHQAEWDEIVFDTFNFDVDDKFDSKMKNVFRKHDHIISAFSRTASNNKFSRVWKSGIENIYGIMCLARLFGEARDYKYESYEDPTDLRITVSACIGRNGTKDCLYKINKGIYPDFYQTKYAGMEGIFQTGEWNGKHYNISEILKNDISPKSHIESINMTHKIWATKLDNWYTRFLEPYSYSRSRVLKWAKQTIDESLLSEMHKKEEIMKLNKYEIYIP